MKTTIQSVLLLTSLCLVAVSPRAHAVVPPPDGGYPGFTTAEGQNALLSLTTGAANTAVGWYSLFSNSTGSFNTGLGAGTLALNNGDSNTATGTAALILNTTGQRNTANGTAALVNNSTGEDNTAVGAFALNSNTTGGFNTATGEEALFANTTGVNNTATGYRALQTNTEGFANTAVGNGALEANTTGFANTATGFAALDNNTDGASNTAIGRFALVNNVSGNLNTALGRNAGSDITGSGNICIGANVPGEAGVDDSTYIRNVNTLTQNFAAGVNNYVTVRLTDGRLGNTAVVSSQRYKEDIKPLAATSEALYALKPVSFRLKKQYDETQALGFGLIAEEVEKVDAALVYRNAKGQVESVRYEMVNAMLLNEFLKEHRRGVAQDCKIQEQETTIAKLRCEMKALAATVNEQSSQLQKVSAWIETNKAKPQFAQNQ